MEKYKYPDNNDNLTEIYINSKSNAKYWEKSEKNILDKIIKKIKMMPKPINFLDLGCGSGRLFNVFYPYVNSITALEPDYDRYLWAKSEAQKIDANKIVVKNSFIDMVVDKQFNTVMISHVFQHIPFDTIKYTLHVLSNMIPRGGLLFITTTLTNRENDIFTLEYLKNNKHFSEIVTEQEFVERFNDKNVLPVRQFSYNTMFALFSQEGFKIEDMFGYHFNISLSEKMNIKFDEMRNKSKNYEGAKDVLYILRRL